jgi:D-serine dehydratase
MPPLVCVICFIAHNVLFPIFPLLIHMYRLRATGTAAVGVATGTDAFGVAVGATAAFGVGISSGLLSGAYLCDDTRM